MATLTPCPFTPAEVISQRADAGHPSLIVTWECGRYGLRTKRTPGSSETASNDDAGTETRIRLLDCAKPSRQVQPATTYQSKPTLGQDVEPR